MSITGDPIEKQLRYFSRRLRELRHARGLSLKEVAGQSGFSTTFLSRLETGERQASIAAVLALARVFGASLASMFEDELAVEPCLIVRAEEAVSRTANGLTYYPLSNAHRYFNIQPIRIVIPVTRRGKSHYQHEGEEWIYVLAGNLRLSLGGKSYDLKPGDAAHFDSTQPHRLIATGSWDAEVLLVASLHAPPGSQGRPAQSHARRAIPAPVSLPASRPKNL
jgi:transcriptional regulator with XRE-family HTH domain